MLFNRKSKTERFFEFLGECADAYVKEQRRRKEERAKQEALASIQNLCDEIFTPSHKKETRSKIKLERGFVRIDPFGSRNYSSSITITEEYLACGKIEYLAELAKKVNYDCYSIVSVKEKLSRAFKFALTGKGYDWRIFSSLTDSLMIKINGYEVTFEMNMIGKITKVRVR